MIDYAAIFRKKRNKLGYSQYALARMVGISQPFLNQIETGAKKPSIDVFLQLCEVLGFDVVLTEKEQ